MDRAEVPYCLPMGQRGPMAWWSPDPRGVLPLDRLHTTRSLRRSLRRYDVRLDTAFGETVAACRDHPRPGGWITDDMQAKLETSSDAERFRPDVVPSWAVVAYSTFRADEPS